MSSAPALLHFQPDPFVKDGWLGTPEFPAYRANNVVARLDDEPQVDPEHLYFHLLLLDASGQLQDNHSGPCLALARQQSLPERIRFVRVVAELVRFAPCEDRGLSAIGQALTLVREAGVDRGCLVVAAQVLDNVCSEEAVVASLVQLLKLSLGEDDARRVISGVAGSLARRSEIDATLAPRGAAAARISRAKAISMRRCSTSCAPWASRMRAATCGSSLAASWCRCPRCSACESDGCRVQLRAAATAPDDLRDPINLVLAGIGFDCSSSCAIVTRASDSRFPPTSARHGACA